MSIRIEPISLRDLTALDLRAEAASIVAPGDTPLTRDEIDYILDDTSAEEPFAAHPALAYRVHIAGAAETADVLVAVDAGKVGIAWGADAAWHDLPGGPGDITTVEGGDAFLAALHEVVQRELDEEGIVHVVLYHDDIASARGGGGGSGHIAVKQED